MTRQISVNTTSRKVTFTPLGRQEPARTDETLLDVARRASAPIGNSCGGVGVCARCRVRVVSGSENLTPPTEIETRIGSQRGLSTDERFACQAIVIGDCEITTTYW
ncbi:MAG TPA: 2Fe-2S iron-sulfur cluster-binding protein [Thermoanaerobaculia bacterium]|nr:2Fe-2S iron-sulfur cluster-binding protein [Thermoanaerobaculia bacterium]